NIMGKSSSSSTNDIHSSMISFVNPDGIIEKPKINSPSIKSIDIIVGLHAVDFIVDEDKAKDLQCFRNAMKCNIENDQMRFINVNKETLEFNVIYIPSYSGGKINGVHIIYKNITGHDKTNQLLIDAEKYNAARKLALSIADDVKLPLTSLK